MQKTTKYGFNVFAGTFMGILLFCGFVLAQAQPAQTVWKHVTFYDMHSDGSNPEFERNHTGGVRFGMVANTLDAERKPQLGPTPYLNYGIAKWFRPYVKNAPGNTTFPSYTTTGTTFNSTVVYNGMVTNPQNDTSFLNVVIQDSLPFTLQPNTNGQYQYNNQAFFMLDNRGLGNEGKAHNFSFTMELHDTFTYVSGLTFDFSGDDDVWAFIDNRLVMDLGGIHPTANSSFNIDNVNTQLNLGLIPGNRYKFDLFYAERHTDASDIKITTNLINPKLKGLKLVSIPSVDTIKAGDSIVYLGKIYDDTGAGLGGERTEFESTITWSVQPATSATILSSLKIPAGTQTSTNTFYGRTAYQSYIITASFNNPQSPGTIFTASDTVYVKAGKEYKAWIEPDSNINVKDLSAASLQRLRNPLEVASVVMTGIQNQKAVYGVVRDTFGNFVRMASNAVWSEVGSPPPGIASAANGVPPFIGLINRTTLGNTTIQLNAKNLVTGAALLPDNVPVQIYAGYFVKLKFVDAVTGQDVTSISMNTDQDKALLLKGILSNDATGSNWVDASGAWAMTPAIPAEIPVPAASANSWQFKPTAPGLQPPAANVLSAKTDSASVSINVNVFVAAPSKATFTVITSPDSIYAGKPFKAVVTISNLDGLVPGTYCFKADTGSVYQDSLGKGPVNIDPTVGSKNGTSGVINDIPNTNQKIDQCFINGVDTVTLTLYRAPYITCGACSDTSHRLTVVLDTVHALTVPIKVQPGPLNSLRLENAVGVDLPGPITVKYRDPGLTIYSVGYDLYGNRIGKVASNWDTTGNLHSPSQTKNTSQVFMDGTNVTVDETGLLIARALRSAAINDSTGDSLKLIFLGPGTVLQQAVTRDYNGDGYLDAIELTFTLPVDDMVGAGANPVFAITYTVGSKVVSFIPDSVVQIGTDKEHFTVYFKEDSTTVPNAPQTAWTPTINISGLANPEYATCIDGAGPVIWSVTKTINSVADRTKDEVVVTFSEKISGASLTTFSAASTKPDLVLNVWSYNSATGQYSPLNTLQDNPVSTNGHDTVIMQITSFTRINDSTYSFKMTNNLDLTQHNYMTIDSASQKIFDDSKLSASGGNAPNATNRFTPVVVKNGAPTQIIAVPNPSGPIFTRQLPGQFSVTDLGSPDLPQSKTARYWVSKDQAGTVITFIMSWPKSTDEVILLHAKIYDVIGNFVTEGDTTIGYDPSKTTSVESYDIYWNGSNSHEMKVAPGIYRVAVTLTYNNTKTHTSSKTKLWGVIGIAY